MGAMQTEHMCACAGRGNRGDYAGDGPTPGARGERRTSKRGRTLETSAGPADSLSAGEQGVTDPDVLLLERIVEEGNLVLLSRLPGLLRARGSTLADNAVAKLVSLRTRQGKANLGILDLEIVTPGRNGERFIAWEGNSQHRGGLQHPPKELSCMKLHELQSTLDINRRMIAGKVARAGLGCTQPPP